MNVEGSWSDLNHLLDMIEKDPVPLMRYVYFLAKARCNAWHFIRYILVYYKRLCYDGLIIFFRHKLIRLLVDNPPFERARHHRNDREELVERLWGLMNSGIH